jgi:hypothetical protein
MGHLRAFLEKPFTAALFFFFGVVYDNLTLTRIDRLQDNLVLLLYLLILGWLIVLSAQADLEAAPASAQAPDSQPMSWLAKVQPYYPKAIQFLLGGLFSAYAIFYSRSVSLTTTAIFCLVLVGLLVGNEFLHDRLSNVRLLVGLYSLACLSFFTFFLPVLTRLMNTAVFLLGAALSLGLTLGLVWLLTRSVDVSRHRQVLLTGLPGIVVTAVMVVFYFLNWIPPVPLSLRFGGIYHEVAKADGSYRLTFEQGPWYRVWQRSDEPFRGEGPAYCFTAVFAPVDLTTTIYHRWQMRPLGKDGATQGYVTTDRVGFPIAGGRDDGYRGYTVKQRVTPGDWRVDVETADGRIIGRVKFRVEPGPPESPSLETISY